MNRVVGSTGTVRRGGTSLDRARAAHGRKHDGYQPENWFSKGTFHVHRAPCGNYTSAHDGTESARRSLPPWALAAVPLTDKFIFAPTHILVGHFVSEEMVDLSCLQCFREFCLQLIGV